MYEIQLEHTFDAGHRIVGHKGKCARLHGHTYKANILLASEVLVDPGFVVDFGDVKDLLNEWDHKLLLWEDDSFLPLVGLDSVQRSIYGVVTLDFNPTAENMAEDICGRILAQFETVKFVGIELWETPKACARASMHKVMP